MRHGAAEWTAVVSQRCPLLFAVCSCAIQSSSCVTMWRCGRAPPAPAWAWTGARLGEPRHSEWGKKRERGGWGILHVCNELLLCNVHFLKASKRLFDRGEGGFVTFGSGNTAANRSTQRVRFVASQQAKALVEQSRSSARRLPWHCGSGATSSCAPSCHPACTPRLRQQRVTWRHCGRPPRHRARTAGASAASPSRRVPTSLQARPPSPFPPCSYAGGVEVASDRDANTSGWTCPTLGIVTGAIVE